MNKHPHLEREVPDMWDDLQWYRRWLVGHEQWRLDNERWWNDRTTEWRAAESRGEDMLAYWKRNKLLGVGWSPQFDNWEQLREEHFASEWERKKIKKRL